MTKKLYTTALTLLLFFGCGTTSLQTQVKQTRAVNIDKSIKDISLDVISLPGSGGEKIDLKNALIKELSKKGIKVSNNSSHKLTVKILFINNLKEAGKIKNGIGEGLRGGIGARASSSDSLIAGVTIALAGATIGKVMEDSIYKAVVEVNLDGQTTRILAEAKKMGLKADEALPILKEKIAKKIADMF